MKLFVGLGNPGKRYDGTRHNIGFEVIQAFAEKQGWKMKEEKRFQSVATKGEVGSETTHLLMPQTYMNESGVAVQAYTRFYRIDVEDIVVVADDAALPLGELRVREKGSSGGHNGLKSIAQHMGTDGYTRLKVGIGAPVHSGHDLADYVLSGFSADEKKLLDQVIKKSISTLEELLVEEAARVMNRVNKKNRPVQENKNEGQ